MAFSILCTILYLHREILRAIYTICIDEMCYVASRIVRFAISNIVFFKISDGGDGRTLHLEFLMTVY